RFASGPHSSQPCNVTTVRSWLGDQWDLSTAFKRDIGCPDCARSPDFREAAIDGEGLAGDVIGGVGEEEDSSRSHVPAGSLAAEGNRSAVPIGLGKASQSSERCVDESGHDDVNPHSSRSCFFGDVYAQPGQCRLAGRVGGNLGGADDAGGGGGGEDDS